MRGALMSARYDMETAEPDMGQLRSGVKLMQVSLRNTVEVHSLVEVKSFVNPQSRSDAGLGSTSRVA